MLSMRDLGEPSRSVPQLSARSNQSRQSQTSRASRRLSSTQLDGPIQNQDSLLNLKDERLQSIELHQEDLQSARSGRKSKFADNLINKVVVEIQNIEGMAYSYG